jgi:hypothetical protein
VKVYELNCWKLYTSTQDEPDLNLELAGVAPTHTITLGTPADPFVRCACCLCQYLMTCCRLCGAVPLHASFLHLAAAWSCCWHAHAPLLRSDCYPAPCSHTQVHCTRKFTDLSHTIYRPQKLRTPEYTCSAVTCLGGVVSCAASACAACCTGVVTVCRWACRVQLACGWWRLWQAAGGCGRVSARVACACDSARPWLDRS